MATDTSQFIATSRVQILVAERKRIRTHKVDEEIEPASAATPAAPWCAPPFWSSSSSPVWSEAWVLDNNESNTALED
jgi:hypothetical protein